MNYNNYKYICFCADPYIPEAIKASIDCAKAAGKKLLVWYLNAGTLIEYGQEYYKKMQRCLDTFIASKEKIYILMVTDKVFGDEYFESHKDHIDELQSFINLFNKSGAGLFVNDVISDEDLSFLSDISDAYYGNPSVICKDFEIRKKPIMLQSVEI